VYRLRGFFRPFRPPVNLPWCDIRCMRNLRSSPTSSLSPPLPQHKNCEVVSPRIHPSPFIDCRLALITPSSSFTFALLKPSTSRGSRSPAAAMMYLVIAIHFSNSHTMHDFSHPSCRSHVVCPSRKGDVQGDLSCRLDPHRVDHMGGISQICRRPQPDARVSDISRSSPGSATVFDQIPTVVAMSHQARSHYCFFLVEHPLTPSPLRRIMPGDCTANSCTKATFIRSTSGRCLTWNPTAFA
jgi:hypothetical protein